MLQSYEAIFDQGTIRWLGDKPQVETARVIVTMLAPMDSTQPKTRHKASARIAGQGKIIGDLLEPVIPASDWTVLG
ncbi:MAG: hypothetical protein B7Y40_06110 [Gammaproteobacteria bacterium 28-57-27]|nr:MAG: hypothetical protein B7Y40_06110 [Gammaproteobacteria bacterium 28-57-27]